MEAWVEVEGLVWREKGEAFPALQLHKKVVGAVVVCVGHDTSTTYPQIDLRGRKNTIKNIIPFYSFVPRLPSAFPCL